MLLYCRLWLNIYIYPNLQLLKEIVIAFQGFEDARSFIKKHQLFRWILIPGIIYTALFIAGMFLFWHSSDTVVSWMSRQLRIENWLQQERNEWLSFLFVMTGVMLRLVLVLAYFSFFKYLILIIGAPLFAYLSERTEAIIENKEYHFNWSSLKKECIRSMLLDLRNCGWQSVYLLTLILLSLIPVVGWITPIIALVLECYYFGFSMLDYSLAREKLSPQESIKYITYYKGLAIGNGFVFYLMHLLIVLAPAYAIIAATLSIHKMKMK